MPADKSRVIRTAENPSLKKLQAATIITSDGTTLLGADDKSGIAVIMTAAVHLLDHPEIPHGPIRVCFTCDEEIGHGVDHVEIDKLGVVCGYTLDSEGSGRVDGETFSADLAIVTVTGVNTHPSVGKDAMVNALRILSEFISRMPTDALSPETTDGRDGFLHPYQLSGGVATASVRIILRDFETPKLRRRTRPGSRRSPPSCGPGTRGPKSTSKSRNNTATCAMGWKKSREQWPKRSKPRGPRAWNPSSPLSAAAPTAPSSPSGACLLPTSPPASITRIRPSNGPVWRRCKKRSTCSCNWRSPGDARKTEMANDQ